MKKVFMIIAVTAGITSNAFSQTAAEKKAQAEIISLEKAGWQAWKDKNVAWYKENTTEDFLQVFGDGMNNKAKVLALTATECTVKSFSLSDFKFVMLNENAVAMTYTAVQSAVCDGKASAPRIQAAVNYVKRNGKWLEAFYMETPVKK